MVHARGSLALVEAYQEMLAWLEARGDLRLTREFIPVEQEGKTSFSWVDRRGGPAHTNRQVQIIMARAHLKNKIEVVTLSVDDLRDLLNDTAKESVDRALFKMSDDLMLRAQQDLEAGEGPPAFTDPA